MSLPARSLTDVEVRAIRAEAGQRLVVYDAKARGLCLRVTARTKSWSFVYRARGSTRQRRYTIGDYPAWSLAAARDKALTLRRLVQDGRDPIAEAKTRREALTVTGMCERFIERHAKSKLRSWKTYEALLRRDVVPSIGHRRATDVTRAEVANLLDKVVSRAPTAANRLQDVLGSAFSWALSEGLVPSNPVLGLRKRHNEVARDRVLSPDEIRSFWVASESIAPRFRDVLRLVLLTAQRPGECAGITAEEVDLDKELWKLPPSRVKNKRSHLVPLVGEAFRIVQRLKIEIRTGPLLRSPSGKAPKSQDVAEAFGRLRRGLFEQRTTPHDLRRTAATIMGRLDIDQMTIARVLNHASTTKATVTGSTYDRHTYEPQMRRALEALDAELRRIITGERGGENVLPMARAR